MSDLVLALDNGTQSVRALAFDLDGNLVAKARVPLVPYVSKHPGWAEQDPDYFWEKAAEACRALFAASPEIKPRLKALAVTTQRGTVIALDAAGKPVRPAILWLDQRRATEVPSLGPWWSLAFKALRLSSTIAYFQGEAEANWMRAHDPEAFARIRHYLLLSGWLNYKLTGRFVDGDASQVGYVPFDFQKRRWGGPRDWRWRAVAIEPAWLPELFPPGARLGEVSAAAAAETGIPQGLPVFAAGADKACEVLGAGCLDPTVGCLSYGTTATINVTHPRYLEAVPLLPAYPAAIPGHHSLEVQVFRGYWMVSWFKQEFGQHEQARALAEGVEPEQLFDELVAQVPPGSMGLMLQPYWSPGFRNPGPEAKGGVIGFGDVHTRAHLYRAILEGLAYALREGEGRIEKKTGIPLTSLRVSGGGSQSDAALQITADVFGLPASRPHVYETSGLGAAIDAAVGLGLHPGFPAAVQAMTRVSRTFAPDPRAQEMYEALYTRVYRRMYDRLRPLYEEIRTITGYPAQS